MLLQKRTRKRLLQIFLFSLGASVSLKLTDNIPASWLAATIERQSLQQNSPIDNVESLRSEVLVRTQQTAFNLKTNSLTFADGIYFYGESSQPEQLGKEYIIFQVKQNQIEGTFFLPQSEYDCLEGTIDGGKLNLSIKDPEGNTHSHQIAIEKNTSISATNNSPQSSITLQGYQPILQIPTAAKELLVACLRY